MAAIKRGRKPRIETRNKSYPLQDSPFYKLRSKRRLAHLLGADLPKLRKLRHDRNYRRFASVQDKKLREIHEPKPQLDRIHTRIASLLVRIKSPDYLHSGVKGRSNLTNARVHLSRKPLVACDLKGFFDSTTKAHVFSFFSKSLCCSPDVADLLSDLCCIDGHCPTGSRLSMPIAFFANQRMFDELYALANERGITMTLYVDDLTFTGHKANRRLVDDVQRIVEKHGHSIKREKTRLYSAAAPKLVTGAIVQSHRIKARNAHLLALSNDFDRWKARAKSGPQHPKLAERIRGRLNNLAGIDPVYKQRARSFNAEARRPLRTGLS